MRGGLSYACPNDVCPANGVAVPVYVGKTADCVRCGWTMVAVPPTTPREETHA